MCSTILTARNSFLFTLAAELCECASRFCDAKKELFRKMCVCVRVYASMRVCVCVCLCARARVSCIDAIVARRKYFDQVHRRFLTLSIPYSPSVQKENGWRRGFGGQGR